MNNVESTRALAAQISFGQRTVNAASVLRIVIATVLLNAVITPAFAQSLFGTGNVVPQLLDGNSYRTIVYLQNLGLSAEPYELDLLNEDGTPASFHFAEVSGTTSSLIGTLQPLAAAVFHTNGGMTITQVGWGSLQNNPEISVYAVIESANPVTGDWTTQSLVIANGIFITDEIQAFLLFDQTSGYVCGAGVVNEGFSAATLTVEARNVNGSVVGSNSLTIQPMSHVSFLLSALVPSTAGIAGSLRFSNSTGNQFSYVAIMGIKATSYKSGWTETSLPVIEVIGLQIPL